MNRERIEKAVDVIKYAIVNKISVKEASVKCGYADTYVKNIKSIVYNKYENDSLDDELFTLFDEAYNDYLFNKENITTKETQVPPSKKKTVFNVKDDEAELEWVSGSNYSPNHIKTLDDLLKIMKVNMDVWRVKDYLINKWDVTSWKSGEPETIENFQVKAKLEKNVNIVETQDIAQIFKNLTENYSPPTIILPQKVKDNKPNSPVNNNENNLLEISIFDLHIGKLSWAGETFENYDVKIAKERFLMSIQKLIDRARGINFSKILFPIGNDFFNTDNIFNTTTKGTPQDEDLRWQKTFTVGTELKQANVPIDVLIIPGNHDFERSFYMGRFLEAWFKNDEIVDINNGASPRKYYRFGNVLLGFTHGNEEKEASLPMLMANDVESKPLWSETKFHEWHLGHIHRKRNVKYTVLDRSRLLNEELGVTVRYLSSLSGTEEWHHKKGFIGSTKAADAFIWNDEFGLVAHLNTNLIIN